MSDNGAESPGFFARLEQVMAARHYSANTRKAYSQWLRRFVRFNGQKSPRELGQTEIVAFLNSIAVEHSASASTHTQALCAILFAYRHVLGLDLPWMAELERPRRPSRLPIVLTKAEVQAVLLHMDGVPKLMASLLYGAGLRLLECARLRVKDIDFGASQIIIRDGKGAKDRATVLPWRLREPLQKQLTTAQKQHRSDLAAGAGHVQLPTAILAKYPSASREWPWQWAFPATRTYRHEPTGQERRHHLHETVLQRAFRSAGRSADGCPRAVPEAH